MFPRFIQLPRNTKNLTNDEEAELMNTLQHRHQTFILNALKAAPNPATKKKLLVNIHNLNLPQIFDNFQRYTKHKYSTIDDHNSLPLRPTDVQSKSQFTPDEQQKLTNEGIKIIRQGHVGVLLLAAGDGTRLGCDGPKAFFETSMPSKKSLLNLLIDMVKFVSDFVQSDHDKEKRCVIPIYILINQAFFDDVRKYLEDNKFFGYTSICLHEVETLMPMLDKEGRIVMKNSEELLRTGGGNGQIIDLLRLSLLKQMEEDGVQYVHICPIDNILMKPADPLFVGFTKLCGADFGHKVVEKTAPEICVGVYIRKNDRFSVWEYSNMDISAKSLRNKDGSLLYKHAHVLNLMVSVHGIRQMVNKAGSIQSLNFAKRNYKVWVGGSDSDLVEFECIKFERFFLDYYELVDKQCFLGVPVEEEYAPLKNKEGPRDTPSTAHAIANAAIRKKKRIDLNKPGIDELDFYVHYFR